MLVILGAAFAQTPTAPVFEVATIKPTAPRTGGGRASASGHTVVYNNTTECVRYCPISNSTLGGEVLPETET
jgi:hypothetical protein